MSELKDTLKKVAKDTYGLEFRTVGVAHGQRTYEVLKNPWGLTPDKVAAIINGGEPKNGFELMRNYIIIFT